MRTSRETITATANQSKRTFTLRRYLDGEAHTKYRTTAMSKQEFESAENNTQNDWYQFLKTGEYDRV